MYSYRVRANTIFCGGCWLKLAMHEEQTFRTGWACRHSIEHNHGSHAAQYPTHGEGHNGQKAKATSIETMIEFL